MGRLNGLSRGAIVVSCEHASRRIPAVYRRLGLPAPVLRTHVAYDIGAAEVALALAQSAGVACYLGSWSRLVIDLNRSLHHPKLCPAVTFGVRVSGNEAMSPEEKARRVERYYRPYRAAVTAAVNATRARYGRCLHLSVHSFTPDVGARVRRCDVGLLYDPRRTGERELAVGLAARLKRCGLRVRRNFPYRGVADGFATALRRELPGRAYMGIEIEMSQALSATRAGRLRLTRALIMALSDVVAAPR